LPPFRRSSLAGGSLLAASPQNRVAPAKPALGAWYYERVMGGEPRLILASASPRRRELLGQLRLRFEVVPSEIDEVLAGPPTPETVAALALAKARAVACRVGAGVVLGADTVVVLDGVALGKPVDAGDAAAILRRLRGRAHEVITGIAAVDAATGRTDTTAVVTRVVMAEVTDDAIAAYVAGGEPLDKAGAYGIQGAGSALVARYEGSYSNVVGLPLAATARLLRSFGVALSESAADR
jgi:septum formation protein